MDYKRVEEETLNWINRARTTPQSLVQELKDMLPHFKGREYKDPESKVSINTNEVDIG